ncbi:chemotaxis protein CheW [Phormidesmis priestleyi]
MMVLQDETSPIDCWNHIGVEGDRSCDRLATVLHCRNCSVYSTAGRSLLEREVSIADIAESTQTIASESVVVDRLKSNEETLSLILFRLGNERFAFSVRSLQEVIHPIAIHTLPHRSNDVFLGLVSIRGEILLCASLRQFLGLDPANKVRPDLERMLVVGADHRKWVFPIDEVDGIYRFSLSEIREAPIVITKANTYTQGILDWNTEKVSCLDAERLFDMLDRGLV